MSARAATVHPISRYVPGPTLGARLRHERERRQIALKSIAESTKIHLPLLEGLEADDVSRWPKGIFRKSFVKAYAQAIGLDAEAIALEFEELYPDPLRESTHPLEGPLQPQTEPVVVKVSVAPTGAAFTRGTLLSDVRMRGAAAASDVGVPCLIALGLYPALGQFWMLLGVSMMFYYLGGIVLLGNTPGVCLFAPQTDRSSET